MPLDTLLSNIFLENLGTTFESLLFTNNILTYSNFSLTFNNINSLIKVLNLWPTNSEFSSTITHVYFILSTTDSYIDSIAGLMRVSPYLYSLDFLHFYYVKEYLYKYTILSTLETTTSVIRPITYLVNLDLFFSVIFSKWGYAFFIFFLTYFFSNILKFRYQYGFNFYFNYFKMLSDLGEQEYGSYDDFKFFLFFLVQMFMWYCWVLFIGYTFSVQSESKLVLLTLSVMITILTIPVRLLWDFGLAFGMYVRGAASSSNLIIEAFFDIIGVVIIFTRFIVQNIRFLLVFVAFFELFEWVATSSESNYFLQIYTPFSNFESNTTLVESKSMFILLINSIKTIFIYLYHLLHLIVVSFMQIGVYLMVSFWLFFFLYTSFFKTALDSYFSTKRNA